MKPGAKLFSVVSDAVVVVVRSPGRLVVECGGRPMSENPVAEKVGAAAVEGEVQIGKRYEDVESGVQLLCVKPGAGELTVNDRPLTLVAPKQLPSSD